MKEICLEELNIIEEMGFKNKLKNKKDYVQIYDNNDMGIYVEFGYVISISGIEKSRGKIKVDSLTDTLGERDIDISMGNLVEEVKSGKSTYKLTVYISPTTIQNNIDKEVWNDEIIKDDVIDKIYRFYDVKLDKNNIEVNRDGSNRMLY